MGITDKLTDIASAIREKTGSTDLLTLDQMPDAIESIQTGSSDVPFKYGGLNGVKVAEYSTQFTLADTSFVIGSSASTSSTSIKASVANMYTTPDSPTIAYGDKDIIVVQKCLCKPTYSDGATDKARQTDYVIEHIANFSKRKTTDTSARTYRQAYSTSYAMNKYYSSSGVLSRGNANYGFYMSPQTAGVYSTTASSTYIRCGSPILYYRVSSSYLSATNIKLVTECTFDWKLEVYTVDAFSSVTATCNAEIDDILVNGI